MKGDFLRLFLLSASLFLRECAGKNRTCCTSSAVQALFRSGRVVAAFSWRAQDGNGVSVEGKSILEWILDTCVCIYTCISCTCLCLGAGMVQKDMLITSSLIYLGWIRDSMVLWLWLRPRASPKFKDISFHPMKSHWVFDKEATLELSSNNTHHA